MVLVSSPLITTGELREALGRVTVLDVRWRLGGPPGAQDYAAGHVPGAAYVDLERDLAGPRGAGGRHPLPATADFEAAMRRCGVSERRPVVVYDDWAGRAAGRAWWLLRHHGHAGVRVLDGGWSAWVADGGEVERGHPSVAAGDFTVRPGAGDFTVRPGAGDFTVRPGGMPVVGADAVRDVGVLVDAREADRYRGEHEPVDPVAGHIPGAVNVPTSRNLRPDGRFRSVDELRDVYSAIGAVPRGDVAAYCGSGVTAAHDLLALELLGVRAALYPGGWSEWIADPARR